MQIRKFTILPRIPQVLANLNVIAHNLWWTWTPEAVGLFRQLDPDLFETANHNPVKMLGVIDQARLDLLARDTHFVEQVNHVARMLQEYLHAKTWFQTEFPKHDDTKIAYFSAEFGLHESFPIYSGGLGVLAGDHLKSASDLGVPLVGVGLLYQQGYFRQYLNADGWQQERYPENDFYNMSCEPQRGSDGKPVRISVEYPGRLVHAQVWRLAVGRVSLYLLDTNLPENTAQDREITYQLYGGDQDMRVRQELMLGIGGLRALRAVGIRPTVCHMNEGHSAFLALERVINLIEEQKVDFDTARQIVSAGNVFTTHTPVEAGNDMFPAYLVETYLQPYLTRLGIDRDRLLGLGRQRPEDRNEPFCMTVLAIRLANRVNGVSQLHGKVSRKMWRNIWPGVPESDLPIESITNGIHFKSFVCEEMWRLYDRHLGPDWIERPCDQTLWSKVESIPDHELWRIHQIRREKLVQFARARLAKQLRQRGLPASEVAFAEQVLDPDALTLGFARRFATYKRANLIFRDVERLSRILNAKDRPVQIVFAGKAHPRDNGGKELIAQIIHMVRREDLRRHVVFIEDYDINVARYMVQGVDIWLNNPRRPLEASGTSGMKGPINGSLNLSILDGWWCEGFKPGESNGWAIGYGEEYSDLNYQDEVESRAIYDLLEKEIVPLFYDRQPHQPPHQWVHWMKKSIMTIAPFFNTHRMVEEYTRKFYLTSAQKYRDLGSDSGAIGKTVAQWYRDVASRWSEVSVERVTANGSSTVEVGGQLEVEAVVRLGTLTPRDVRVEICHGEVDAADSISSPETIAMTANSHQSEQGTFVFAGTIPCRTSGQHGFSVRVLPQHPYQVRQFEPGLIRWG